MENTGAARSCGILSSTEAEPMSGFAKACSQTNGKPQPRFARWRIRRVLLELSLVPHTCTLGSGSEPVTSQQTSARAASTLQRCQGRRVTQFVARGRDRWRRRGAGIMPAMQGGGREGENGGERDTGADTFNFVKLGLDETDGELLLPSAEAHRLVGGNPAAPKSTHNDHGERKFSCVFQSP